MRVCGGAAYRKDLAVERYRLGINSYLNVITAQVSLLSNQQTDVSIRLQRMTSAVQLVMALGGGWSTTNMPTPKGVFHSSGTNDGALLAQPHVGG